MHQVTKTDGHVRAEAVWRYLTPPVGPRDFEARKAYSPVHVGVLPADMAAIVTWKPPSPARLEKVLITAAPRGTHVLSLVVGGEETVDPTIPLAWECFRPGVWKGEIGIIVLPTQTVVMRLQRPPTM